MTNITRLQRTTDEEKLVLRGVDSAFENTTGVVVEFEEKHSDYGKSKTFNGYELVGFGR